VLAEKEHLDWPNIARILRQEGFQGSGSVVLAPEGDAAVAARKAATYIRALFGGPEEEGSVQKGE
jgi:hypothetical protein